MLIYYLFSKNHSMVRLFSYYSSRCMPLLYLSGSTRHTGFYEVFTSFLERGIRDPNAKKSGLQNIRWTNYLFLRNIVRKRSPKWFVLFKWVVSNRFKTKRRWNTPRALFNGTLKFSTDQIMICTFSIGPPIVSKIIIRAMRNLSLLLNRSSWVPCWPILVFL